MNKAKIWKITFLTTIVRSCVPKLGTHLPELGHRYWLGMLPGLGLSDFLSTICILYYKPHQIRWPVKHAKSLKVIAITEKFAYLNRWNSKMQKKNEYTTKMRMHIQWSKQFSSVFAYGLIKILSLDLFFPGAEPRFNIKGGQ